MTAHPTLRRKLLRDIRTQWPQFGALVLIVVLGVALFTAAYGAYRNLNASYNRVFAEEKFADLWVTAPDAAGFAATARSDPAVAAAEVRSRVDLGLQVGANKLRGRIIGVPPGHPPAVNSPTVLSGRYPAAADEILVEHHMADHFGLREGDRLTVHGSTGWHTVVVAGVVSSAEYLWPARSRHEMFPLPDNFGVLFAPEPLVAAIATDAVSEAVVRFTGEPGADTLDRYRQLAQQHGATEFVERADQPSNWLLRMDIDAFGELAYLFPLLFLTVAGLVAYVLLSRRVRTERTIIGVLLAGGMERRAVLSHYLQYGLLAGLFGAAGGILLGLAASRALSTLYLRVIDLPEAATVITVAPITVLGGVVFGVVAGVLGAFAPALFAFRTPPAAAMRGATPDAAGRISLLERLVPPLRRLPARWLLVLRNIGRNPRRTWSTVLGTSLSLLLVLTSWTMLDTMRTALDISFHEVQKADARVDFTGPIDRDRLTELTAAPGVTKVEPVVQLPVTLSADNQNYPTTLVALPRDTAMHGFRPVDGAAAPASDEEILVGKGIRHLLQVNAGDTVELGVAGTGSVRVRVAGLLDEPLGTFVYVSLEQLDALAGMAVPINSALLQWEPGADPAAIRSALTERPGVAAYEDLDEVERLVDRYAGLFYAFLGAMLALGGLMAFAIIFTTMSINIVERRREVAVLRAGGMAHGMVARLLTGENLLMTLLGIVPGLVLGVLGGRGFLSMYINDQFQLGLVVLPATLIVAALAVLFVATVSLAPGLRAVRGLDLAAVVRERSD